MIFKRGDKTRKQSHHPREAREWNEGILRRPSEKGHGRARHLQRTDQGLKAWSGGGQQESITKREGEARGCIHKQALV